jgi:hypothetical protein
MRPEGIYDIIKALELHSFKASGIIALFLMISDGVGPVSRFGDTAANAGILALLQSNSYLKDLPSPIKTIFASLW